MIASQVRILVVDDERNIRNNLTMVLESAGYKVDANGDGEDALTKCKERHYDIASRGYTDAQDGRPRIAPLPADAEAKPGSGHSNRLRDCGQRG